MPKELIELSCLTANFLVPSGPRFCTDSCSRDVEGVASASPETVKVVLAETLPKLSTENEGVFVSGLSITFSGS